VSYGTIRKEEKIQTLARQGMASQKLTQNISNVVRICSLLKTK
jgi:hypothetical protein